MDSLLSPAWLAHPLCLRMQGLDARTFAESSVSKACHRQGFLVSEPCESMRVTPAARGQSALITVFLFVGSKHPLSISFNPSRVSGFGKKGASYGFPDSPSAQTCSAMAGQHCTGQLGMQCVPLDSVNLVSSKFSLPQSPYRSKGQYENSVATVHPFSPLRPRGPLSQARPPSLGHG